MGADGHVWLLGFKLSRISKIRIEFLTALTTCQVLSSHLWLTAPFLRRAEKAFPHDRDLTGSAVQTEKHYNPLQTSDLKQRFLVEVSLKINFTHFIYNLYLKQH